MKGKKYSSEQATLYAFFTGIVGAWICYIILSLYFVSFGLYEYVNIYPPALAFIGFLGYFIVVRQGLINKKEEDEDES